MVFRGGRLEWSNALKENKDYTQKNIPLLEQCFRDSDFDLLLKLHTREGLEKMQTPQARRETLLSAAKEIRSRNGCYAVAGEFLEELFSKELGSALQEIRPEKKLEFQKEVEGERSKTEKQAAQDQLQHSKEKEPKVFRKISGGQAFPGRSEGDGRNFSSSEAGGQAEKSGL